MSEILSYWPFECKPRNVQIKGLEWLEKQTAKYLILEAPVGSGKSYIAATYSRFLSKGKGSSFILTPQKILQEQYETSFAGVDQIPLASLYGKGNYHCSVKKTNCDIGSIVKPTCASCPHTQAKKTAKQCPNTVMNYKLALVTFGYTNIFADKRTLMVLDECHTLESHLVDFDTVMINEYKASKCGATWKLCRDTVAALQYVTDTYLPKLKSHCDDLQDECDPLFEKAGSELTTSEIKKIRELNGLLDHKDEVEELTLRPLDYIEKHYVLVHDKLSFSFKRLYGSYSFSKILDHKADRFLFMSSTILNKEGFCRDLGIDPKETAFLSLESEFPVGNRPVIYAPQMKMNAEWNSPSNKMNRNTMLASIKHLLDEHKTESGIIHTANFQVAKWLVENLEFNIPHRVYHHNPDSGDHRGDIINAFMGDKRPAILISPSITEGLDLKDDLARFAMFVKVPYLYLGDQWVKKRMDTSVEWYQRQAVINVIQGGGRVVRTPEDKGVVYILDGSWAYLQQQTNHMIPQWWKDSLQKL